MNFEKALSLCKLGEAIKRETWTGISKAVANGNGGMAFYDLKGQKVHCDVNSYDVMATDWRVVK